MNVVVKKEVSTSTELQVIRGCIWHTDFIKAVADRPVAVMSADWTKRLFTLAKKYFKAHRECAGTNFKEYVKDNRVKFKITDDEWDVLAEKIDKLKPFPDGTNVSYEVEKANKLFDEIILRETTTKLEDALDASDIDLANKLVKESHSQLEVNKETSESGLKSFTDDNVAPLVMKAHEDEGQPLIPFRGALGLLFNNFIKKRRFVAFLATAKAGKTWILYTLAKEAARNNIPTLLIGCGDEKEVDMANRLSHMTAYNPMQFDPNGKKLPVEYTAIREEDGGEYAFPVCDCLHNQVQDCKRNCPNKVGLKAPVEEMMNVHDTPERLFEALPKAYRACPNCEDCPECMPTFSYEMHKVAWRGENWLASAAKSFSRNCKSFAFNTYNNSTVTIAEIEKNIEQYKEMFGCYPSLVLLDYADIMAPEKQTEGEAKWDATRHGENRRWQKLKNLVDKYEICLCTTTQSNRSGYDTSKVLTPANLNEDRRKADHVNALFGLMATPKERQFRIARLSCILARGRSLNLYQQVHLCQAMEGGRFWRETFLRVVREDPKPKEKN